ncbi:hypothetical protein N2W54_000265 [Lotmaria passim]
MSRRLRKSRHIHPRRRGEEADEVLDRGRVGHNTQRQQLYLHRDIHCRIRQRLLHRVQKPGDAEKRGGVVSRGGQLRRGQLVVLAASAAATTSAYLRRRQQRRRWRLRPRDVNHVVNRWRLQRRGQVLPAVDRGQRAHGNPLAGGAGFACASVDLHALDQIRHQRFAALHRCCCR